MVNDIYQLAQTDYDGTREINSHEDKKKHTTLTNQFLI